VLAMLVRSLCTQLHYFGRPNNFFYAQHLGSPSSASPEGRRRTASMWMVPDLGHVNSHARPMQQCHMGLQGVTLRTRPLVPPPVGRRTQAEWTTLPTLHHTLLWQAYWWAYSLPSREDPKSTMNSSNDNPPSPAPQGGPLSKAASTACLPNASSTVLLLSAIAKSS